MEDIDVKNIFKNIGKFISKYKFAATFVFFVLWVGYFGSPSLVFYKEKQKEIEVLKGQIDYFEKETENNKVFLNEMESNDKVLEKYARERYFMKKRNEVVYEIEEID